MIEFPKPGDLWAHHRDEWCVLLLDERHDSHGHGQTLQVLVLWDRDGQWPAQAVRRVSPGYLINHGVKLA